MMHLQISPGRSGLDHNTNARRYLAGEISYDAVYEGGEFLSDEGEADPLRAIIEEELRREETLELHTRFATLTEKQRYVLIQCVVYGRMQIDVADEMGTSRVNVTQMLQRGLNKLREYYGINDRYFGTNHFYRSNK